MDVSEKASACNLHRHLTHTFTFLPGPIPGWQCRKCDAQVGTPEMKPVACYLDVEGIIQIAKAQKVDAIHPGYPPPPHTH